jgi:hypothetical protein
MIDLGDAIPGIVDLATEKLSLRTFAVLLMALTLVLLLWWQVG